MPLHIDFAGKTDAGKIRGRNEDACLIIEEEKLFVVCDGMGGHAAGDVASNTAVESIRSYFQKTGNEPGKKRPGSVNDTPVRTKERLIESIRFANRSIYRLSRKERKYSGMGTTVVAARFEDNGVWLSHVGDSRVYRIRDGIITQLTTDHSLLNEYLANKKMSADAKKNFPYKNVILRALGISETVQVDSLFKETRINDLYLLCSDGLTDEISDTGILEIYDINSDNLQKTAQALIDRACRNGGHDNVTVILVKIVQT